jgi:hypothetical protein
MAFDTGELLVGACIPSAMDSFHAVAGATKSGGAGPLIAGPHHQQEHHAGYDAKQEQFPAIHPTSPPILQVLSFTFYMNSGIPAKTNRNDKKI